MRCSIAIRTTPVFVLSLCVLASGCSMFGRGKLAGDDLASIDDVRGPAERRLQQVAYETTAAVASRESDPALIAAKEIFTAGDYEKAEKAYKTILGRYRPDSVRRTFGSTKSLLGKKSADDRAIEAYGSPIEQECLFMIAECQFARRDFKQAEESYGRLLRRYPATRHLDTVSNRTYTIARHWLGFPPAKVAAGPSGSPDDIQQVVFTDVQQSSDPAIAPESSAWLNLTDGTKPTFDTTGRALNALKSIWLNDPTGPLADDALILTANHYYRAGDPVEAARYYELLREQYPDSPHLKNAYLLESHVRLISYAGDRYDDTNLEESAKLKQASLQMFPDLESDQRQQLSKELSQIEDAMIAREWSLVELYRQKNRPAAIRLHCNAIINQYPDSRYADRARAMLQMLSEEERSGRRSFWPFGGREVPALPAASGPKTAKLDLRPPRLSNSRPPVQTAQIETPASPRAGVVMPEKPMPAVKPAAFEETPEWAKAPANVPSSKPGPSPVAPAAPVVQASATVEPSGNPFAEIMQTSGTSTKAGESAVRTADWEIPAGESGSSVMSADAWQTAE